MHPQKDRQPNRTFQKFAYCTHPCLPFGFRLPDIQQPTPPILSLSPPLSCPPPCLTSSPSAAHLHAPLGVAPRLVLSVSFVLSRVTVSTTSFLSKEHSYFFNAAKARHESIHLSAPVFLLVRSFLTRNFHRHRKVSISTAFPLEHYSPTWSGKKKRKKSVVAGAVQKLSTEVNPVFSNVFNLHPFSSSAHPVKLQYRKKTPYSKLNRKRTACSACQKRIDLQGPNPPAFFRRTLHQSRL